MATAPTIPTTARIAEAATGVADAYAFPHYPNPFEDRHAAETKTIAKNRRLRVGSSQSRPLEDDLSWSHGLHNEPGKSFSGLYCQAATNITGCAAHDPVAADVGLVAAIDSSS